MVKACRNLILWNQKAEDVEPWYTVVLEFYSIVQMMPLGWQGQIVSSTIVYGKKLKQWI